METKNEHFWMISGVKGFLVKMTTAVDLNIWCALCIPPKYYFNMFFFSSHEKWTNVTVFFSIQRGTVCPLEDFHYKDSQTMTLPHSLGNSHCPWASFRGWCTPLTNSSDLRYLGNLSRRQHSPACWPAAFLGRLLGNSSCHLCHLEMTDGQIYLTHWSPST